MATDTFTTREDAGTVKGSFPLLWRYMRSLPLLCRLSVPALLCGIVGTVGYQLFVLLSGAFAECGAKEHCTAAIPHTGITVPLAIPLLCGIAALVVSIRVLGWLLYEVGGQWAALPLFRSMVRSVGRVRTTFFDEYPSGKLINRMVRDFDTLRVMGPVRMGDTVNSLLEIFVIAAVIFFAHPLAALAVFPTLAVFFYIQRNVAPMMQRCLALRAVKLGEVLHRETDVIEGMRTFVLYRQEDALFRRLREAVHGFIQMHVLRFHIEAWGRFWSQTASAIYGFLTLLCVAWSINAGTLTPVLGAVVITAVFRLGGAFAWLTWSSGLLFESAAHARRVFEYLDLPHEETEERSDTAPRETEGLPPGSRVDLEFARYSMSYRNNSPVILADLNLKIPQGQRLGIIGRTGAGKTSLVQALYRMVHVRGGDIRVGSVSLLSLPIEDARALFAVVPQDPYLFEGTIRTNLDRYGEYPDEKLAVALEAARLDFGLDYPIREGGKNLSLGQRQLLCLARVMVTERPVVVMDEPTSGVDTITDATIQRILRTALADRTVITIAHRLETLTHMDRIVEIREGKVVKDGTPGDIIGLLRGDELA